jgi:hypothetical protein
MGPHCDGTIDALYDLLSLSLAAWRIAGQVRHERDGTLIVTAGEQRLRVERVRGPLPYRWMVSGEKNRGAMSVAGVLRAVRGALDPGHRSVRLRIGSLPPLPPASLAP